MELSDCNTSFRPLSTKGVDIAVERKNGWQLAEDKRPDATQRLMYSTKWDADAVRDALQRFVIGGFGDAAGVGVIDETGFLKKGVKSAGVQRQYSGTADKVENCHGCLPDLCNRARTYFFGSAALSA